MLTKPIRSLAAIATWLCIGAACLAEPLTIAVTPSALSLPVDVARAQGFFTAEGLDVRVVDCASGPVCLKLLFDGTAHMAAAAELPIVNAGFERSDFALISTIATSTGNIRLLARKSAGIARAKDLVGMRVGAIAGTSAHYFLETYLLFHDIDPRQIKFVPLTGANAVAAMERREVDAFAGFTQHTSAITRSLKSDSVVLDDPHIYTETYNLVVQRSLLASRSAEVRKVLRALDRAEQFIAKSPAEAKQMVIARTAVDAALLDTIFPSFTYRLSLNQSLISAMEGEGRWAIREGHASAKTVPNYLKLVDDGPLRSAVPSAFPR